MSAVIYRRLSMSRPPLRELVEVGDDGEVSIWRSNAAVIGRLAGAAETGRPILDLAGSAAAVAAPSVGSAAPDQPFEMVEVGEASLALPDGATVPGPWGELVAACRDALDRGGEPLAAVALVADGPSRLRLEHRGSEVLRIGVGRAQVSVTAYRDGLPGAAHWATLEGDLIEAGPDWSLAIEVPGAEAVDGAFVAAVEMNANDRGVWIPVRLEVASGG